MVEINCETDFVAKNEAFKAFATKIAEAAGEAKINSGEELNNLEIDVLTHTGGILAPWLTHAETRHAISGELRGSRGGACPHRGPGRAFDVWQAVGPQVASG